MTKNIYFSFVGLLVLTLGYALPNVTHAAVAGFTGPDVRMVTENLAVFTFTDTFAINDRTMLVPALGSTQARPDRFSYSLDHKGSAVPSLGFVVAKATSSHGFYTFGPNERATFTAVILAPLPYIGASTDDFAVSLERFPLIELERED